MGRADHLVIGDWNATCDRCGRKRKGSELRRTWQGYMVCPEHWEPRHPQDFVRTVKEDLSPPFVREPASRRILYCTPNSRTAIADYAVCDCAIADFTDPAFDPNVVEDYS